MSNYWSIVLYWHANVVCLSVCLSALYVNINRTYRDHIMFRQRYDVM